MQAITELGYLGLEVRSLSDWGAFAEHALGMSITAGPLPDTRWLQMDEQRCRVILTEGPADDHAFAGWRMRDPAAVEAFGRMLTERGIAWTWARDNELALRAVQTMLHFEDPTGTRHEVFAQPLSVAAPVVPARFVTGEGGMGHAVYFSPDYPATVRFVTEVLGFRMTDTVEADVGTAQEIHIEASFLHTNQRHHSFAVAQQPGNAPGQKRLHHFMAELDSVAAVGIARDRCLALGLTVVQDIGQHRNDQMISFYVQSPSGFFVELGWGGRKVDVDTWQVRSYDRFSEWGHRPAQGYDFVGKKD